MTLTIGSFCTGFGGLDMAAEAVLGGELAWYSEIEPAALKVLEHHYPAVPNIGDLTRQDWSTVPAVDIITAGYPCQPFSLAGRRKGTDDERHLWPKIAEAVRHIRPGFVILENVAGHRSKGLDQVVYDLAEMGYRVGWGSVRASDAGAAHRRERIYIVAEDPDREPRLKRWTSAPGQAEGGRSRADSRGRGLRALANADTHGAALAVGESERGDSRPERTATIGGSGGAVPDAAGFGRSEGGAEHEGQRGRPDVTECGAQAIDWQEYEAAVRRWERRLGRPAPYPSIRGPRGGVKVSPAFGEWLMGLPEGWITDVPGLSINDMLKLVGNGVVPQAAELAITELLGILETECQQEQAA